MPSFCPFCNATLPGSSPTVICPVCAKRMAGAMAGATSSSKDRGKLFIRTSEGQVAEYSLSEKTRIGRHPVNSVRLADREISKEHAEISLIGSDFWIQDLNSSNGTFVNGRRVTRIRLSDGDEITLGGTLIVFRNRFAPVPVGAGVTMVQACAPQVLASLRAEESRDFRPEKEIKDVLDLRRDYEKLRIANEFHHQVGLERDLSTLYDKILKVAFDLLNADNGVILLFCPKNQQLTTAAVYRRKPVEVMLSQTLLDQVLRTHEGVLTQDAIVDARFSCSQSIVAQGIRSAMAVPLISKSQLRGILYLDTRELAGAFTEKDLRILTGVSAQAAVAIENAELARRIEQEAETRVHLSRFLSPALVEQAQKGQLELKKGGELCEVTILFADIRGFTSMTERSQPQEIVALLNEYFEEMVEEVFAQGGVLDKFIGDCIMAMWGAPVHREDDASRAIRAGVGMMQRLKNYNESRVSQGKSPVGMGIGINTGLAVVGNMGSSKRLEYTAIGDSVNLASRLCSIACEGQIVVSAQTIQRTGNEFSVLALPAAKVKGKQDAVPVFQVLGCQEIATSGAKKTVS